MLLVARAAMRRAVSVMTMQRGKDSPLLTLVAFSGGGGLLAAELAEDLGTPRVLVPANRGGLSSPSFVRGGLAGPRANRPGAAGGVARPRARQHVPRAGGPRSHAAPGCWPCGPRLLVRADARGSLPGAEPRARRRRATRDPASGLPGPAPGALRVDAGGGEIELRPPGKPRVDTSASPKVSDSRGPGAPRQRLSCPRCGSRVTPAPCLHSTARGSRPAHGSRALRSSRRPRRLPGCHPAGPPGSCRPGTSSSNRLANRFVLERGGSSRGNGVRGGPRCVLSPRATRRISPPRGAGPGEHRHRLPGSRRSAR